MWLLITALFPNEGCMCGVNITWGTERFMRLTCLRKPSKENGGEYFVLQSSLIDLCSTLDFAPPPSSPYHLTPRTGVGEVRFVTAMRQLSGVEEVGSPPNPRIFHEARVADGVVPWVLIYAEDECRPLASVVANDFHDAQTCLRGSGSRNREQTAWIAST